MLSVISLSPFAGGDHLYINTSHLSNTNTTNSTNKTLASKPRETTFQAVERIIQRLINDGLITEQFGSQLLDQACAH